MRYGNMDMEFYREGGKLFVRLILGDGSSNIVEVDSPMPDGSVRQNPLAYSRFGDQIEEYKWHERVRDFLDEADATMPAFKSPPPPGSRISRFLKGLFTRTNDAE